MTKILSWNIQAAKGVDGIVSVDRIAKDIKNLCDADVLCLQEVLITAENNQARQLAEHFPAHTAVFGAAIDRLDGNGRLQFGNLVLSRLPLLQSVQHKLPQPAEPAAKPMPRQAVEVIIEQDNAPLRIVTTHLEFFASGQRRAQVDYLATHHAECLQRHKQPSPTGGEGQFASLPETDRSIYCGDFNLTTDSDDYQTMTGGASEQDGSQLGDAALIDCWPLLHAGKPHAPTCGIFDREQWQEGPHCRDYFFVSAELAGKINAIEVDVDTAASDHQPLYITLGD
ncbi:MAG: endonuclease/exonuclease/phosphatase family protein [Granulosicoccus sp.]